MIKRILIPLDPSQYTDSAIQLGCMFAKMTNATLTGLVILDIPGIQKSVGPIPMGVIHYLDQLEDYKEKEAYERIQSLLTKFKNKCKQEGVLHCEAELQGRPSDRITEESIFYDAVIIGLRTFFHFETRDKPGDTLKNILDHAVTPIFGVPENISLANIPANKIKTLIAFNGSLPSARALQGFAQLVNPELFKIKLIMSENNEEVARYYLKQARAYLDAHSFLDIEEEWTTKSIIQVMDDKYLDWADMVVLGAHSKKEMFNFRVGNLTRHLIEKANKIVVIGQ